MGYYGESDEWTLPIVKIHWPKNGYARAIFQLTEKTCRT